MKDKSLIFLGLISVFYFFANALTGNFLPNYYISLGLSVNHIILLTALMILSIGIFPLLTLKFLPKFFEKLLGVGIILNIVFYVLLMFVKDPIVLGLACGLSSATFYPAFNLLIFRLTGVKQRGLIAILLYIAIPGVTGIIGPAIGGASIELFGFNSIFILGIAFLAISLIFVFGIKYQSVSNKFIFPRTKLFFLFAVLIAFFGLSEIHFIAYPLFVYVLSGGFLEMGLVMAAITIIFVAVSLIAGKFSEVERNRINFAVFNALMWAAWLFALAITKTVPQLIGFSILSAIAGAFWPALFALYGDFFKRKYHATMVVLWEVFLMIGRMANLVPVAVFINNFDFSGYFFVIGITALMWIIPYALLQFLHYKGHIKSDIRQS